MKRYKRFLLSFTAFVLGASMLCGCERDFSTGEGTVTQPSATTVPGSSTASPGGTEAPTVTRPTPEETTAAAMVAAIFANYAEEGGKGTNAYINLHEYHNSTQSGFLWSNFCGVGMQYYVCKLYPGDETQKEIFRKMINNFKYFRQRRPADNAAENSVKYHSARGMQVNGGSGDCFFDDNIWVARNYLRAYEILGDKWFLEEAIRVNNWVISGWDDTLGGIVWSEVGLTDAADAQHLERGLSANACGIIVNAMLAELVDSPEEKAFHLAWAEKFYTFCKRMQNRPTSYDYWNGIATVIENGVRRDGAINKVHYSYNSGSMILADLLMASVTEDEAQKKEYLNDASKTAEAAKRTFIKFDTATRKYYYQGDPWFAAILNEAYFELLDYDRKTATKLLDAFTQNVELAYSNRDKVTGLCPYQANETVSWTRNESYVIHQVGLAQQAVLAALYSLRS